MKEQIKPPPVPAAASTAGKRRPQQSKKALARLWVCVLMILVFMLLAAGQIMPAQSAKAQILAGLPDELGMISTSTPTATPSSQPSAIDTTAPSLSNETIVKVYSDKFSLFDGPGLNYPTGRKLIYGEELKLLGRLEDNTWIYVKTSEGTEGWISPSWIRLGAIDLQTYPIQTPSPFPETLLKVLNDGTNLRTGPGHYYAKVLSLPNGEMVKLLGRSNDRSWLYVKTTNGQDGWVKSTEVDTTGISLEYDYYPVKTPPPTETSTPVILTDVEGHWIDVDLSEQTLRAYDGTQLVGTFRVSTGIIQYPTETGQYHVYAKFRYTLMSGSDYYLPDVPYTMFYSGDFSIHGTYWHHNFGTPMSHGCINMDTPDAEWLYNWSEVGTLVNIHY